jgi:hypothetical protein
MRTLLGLQRKNLFCILCCSVRFFSQLTLWIWATCFVLKRLSCVVWKQSRFVVPVVCFSFSLPPAVFPEPAFDLAPEIRAGFCLHSIHSPPPVSWSCWPERPGYPRMVSRLPCVSAGIFLLEPDPNFVSLSRSSCGADFSSRALDSFFVSAFLIESQYGPCPASTYRLNRFWSGAVCSGLVAAVPS